MSRRGWLPLAAWAVFLAVAAGVLALWSDDLLPSALLGGAAVAAAALAGLDLAASRLGPVSGEDEVVVIDRSGVPAVLAAGVTLLLNGLAFGLWLILAGAEIIALAAGMWIGERRRPRA